MADKIVKGAAESADLHYDESTSHALATAGKLQYLFR